MAALIGYFLDVYGHVLLMLRDLKGPQYNSLNLKHSSNGSLLSLCPIAQVDRACGFGVFPFGVYLHPLSYISFTREPNRSDKKPGYLPPHVQCMQAEVRYRLRPPRWSILFGPLLTNMALRGGGGSLHQSRRGICTLEKLRRRPSTTYLER